jgi:hypothetical protein
MVIFQRYASGMDLNARYRAWLHVRRPDLPHFVSGEDVPLDAEYASLSRDKASHKGIGRCAALKELAAAGANQAFLDEIGDLAQLEYLDLAWPLTAADPGPLPRLTELRHLVINSPRNVTDFTPLLDLPRLERLFIENAKHMRDLDWLRPLGDRLVALGVEGSMWTPQPIDSLAPLEGFALEALFLTNTRLADQDLAPVATMPNLRFLGTGLNAPKAQFMALKAARPALQCSWFDEALWANFKDPRRPRR